ncbi:trehalose-phosphatase [Aestuariivirga litoralis]|uniref:Trehalose 6-phosphate phosphatase n=1 Tax=Aestuariivirga litoralis TaxID=2650924 RepID=A0A2W2AJ61_9HYPH|nr:trehalose-phosphatase [Aestuariivirga litoralis]PZF75485.1 trehalose-phosphatase [Aestuariivirga litoralis]
MTTRLLRALPPPPHELLAGASLFLDLDGTLVDIAARPDAVQVDQRLLDLLARLSTMLGRRLVVVSGRPAAEVQAFLRGTGVAVVGSHGAELEGHALQQAAPAPPDDMMRSLATFATTHPGVLIETKPFGIAIHYRLAPQAGLAAHALAQHVAALHGFALQPGKQVIEIKYHRITKGDAVRRLMAVAPMQAGRPLFIGDDETDEAGFAAAAALGGDGILVGPPRATQAHFGLAGVAAALAWLEDAMGCLT